MNVDLHRALGTLADGGERRTAPTDRLLARVHRRRAARAAATGAVSMGAVAAVAIGSVALNGRTPIIDTATTEPTGGSYVPDGPALNCGDSGPDRPIAEASGLRWQADLPSTWAEGEPLVLSGQMDATEEGVALTSATLTVALLADGVVQATGGVLVATSGEGAAELGTPFTGAVIIEPCGTERLAPGEYTAVATLLYDFADDARSGSLQVSAPIVVKEWAASPAAEAAAVAAVAEILAASQGGLTGAPGTCGSTIAAGALDDDSLQVGLSMTHRPELPRPQSFYGHVSVDNVGAQTVAIQYQGQGAQIVLTRDGVVVAVGVRVAPWIDPSPLEIRPGSGWGVTTADSFGVCALPGSDAPDVPLPTGDYQAWAVLTATVTDQDGPAAGTTREVTVVSEPVGVTFG